MHILDCGLLMQCVICTDACYQSQCVSVSMYTLKILEVCVFYLLAIGVNWYHPFSVRHQIIVLWTKGVSSDSQKIISLRGSPFECRFHLRVLLGVSSGRVMEVYHSPQPPFSFTVVCVLFYKGQKYFLWSCIWRILCELYHWLVKD